MQNDVKRERHFKHNIQTNIHFQTTGNFFLNLEHLKIILSYQTKMNTLKCMMLNTLRSNFKQKFALKVTLPSCSLLLSECFLH
jgi:hypothetical protein